MINGLKREQLIACNSMVLHELFFESLGDLREPDGRIRDAMTHDFAGVERWRTGLIAFANALSGSSGWVPLTYSKHDGRLINQWEADYTQTRAGGQPILALDMYEHAYNMDDDGNSAAYVDAYMGAINWPTVRRLYEEYRR